MAEAKWSGVLSTTEPRNDVGIIKVRQGNVNSEVAEFQIVQNNKPYNLTGLTVYFCASFGLNLVEKPAVIVNAAGGRIQYTFDDDSMQSLGRQKGYFSIKKEESKIDSTQDFEYQVESSLMTRSIDGKSYIYKLSALIKILDDFVKNGQKNFNTWFDSVKEILYGVDPGGNILRELIEARKNSSGNIFTSLKERLDKNEDETNRQLAQTTQELTKKATKGEIVGQDLSTSTDAGKIQLINLADEVQQALTGNAPALTTLEDGIVTKEKIANGAVYPEKLAHTSVSPNLFNKNTVTIGIGLDITDGDTTSDANQVTSDFIPVETGVAYKRSHQARLCWYNANYEYLSCQPSNTVPITSVTGTKYAKISFNANLLDTFQFEKGEVTTPHKNFNAFEIENLNVMEDNFSPTMNKKLGSLTETEKMIQDTISPLPNSYPDEIFHLLNSNDPILPLNSAYSEDISKKWGNNSFGWSFKVAGAENSELRSEFTTPKTKQGLSTICGMFYFEDISKINTINIYVGTADSGWNWQRSATPLKNGWNLIRIPAAQATVGEWLNFRRVRILVSTNDSTTWALGAFFGEVPQKAKLLFVQDGGYVEFLERGYPELKDRGIPTTWALNPGRLGVGRIISESDVDDLALDFMSAFSFHSWASEVHADMPAEEVRDNAIKCMRWLQKKGIQPKYWMRAAITQNSAANHHVLKDMVEAYSTPSGNSGLEVFPFTEPFGFARMQLHNRTNAELDSLFDTMKKTRSLMVGYTHGIGVNATTSEQLTADMTPELFNYFLTKVDQGMNEGWLEGVTYDMLRIRQEQQEGGYGFNHLLDATRI